MRPALIRQHVESAPAGLLAEWLDARGLSYEVDRSWLEAPLPDPREYAFVASLGHDRMAGDTHVPAVVAEHELLGRALGHGVPVLGLCYGGQVLAAVLGAHVGRAPVPELGWRSVQTDDPERIPAGPWLEWHFQRFQTPPGAIELARTPEASQAFRVGPHLGVQFHPEATVEIVEGWARSDGVDDVRLTAAPEQREAAAAAAFKLFDTFLADVRMADQSGERLAS